MKNIRQYLSLCSILLFYIHFTDKSFPIKENIVQVHRKPPTITNAWIEHGQIVLDYNTSDKSLVRHLGKHFTKVHRVQRKFEVCKARKIIFFIHEDNNFACGADGHIFHAFMCGLNHMGLGLEYDHVYSTHKKPSNLPMDVYVRDKLASLGQVTWEVFARNLTGCFDIVTFQYYIFLLPALRKYSVLI